jgi:hypothetical protein
MNMFGVPKYIVNILFEILRERGFCESWCRWIQEVISSGTLSVKVNGTTGIYFKSGKGVR